MNRHLTWAQIDLSAIRHNFRVLRKLAGKAKILTVIKADAYGHGMIPVAKVLVKERVDFIGLSNLNEGIALREAGIRTPALLFETTLSGQAKDIVDYGLIPTVCNFELARALDKYARQQGRLVDIHVKIDTGMGRFGVWHEEALSFMNKVRRLRNVRVEGFYTHFPSADTDRTFTRQQIQQFAALIEQLKADGWRIPRVHAANSMGLAALAGCKTDILNLARPGLMLYGLYPHAGLKKEIVLRPAMSVHSRIIFLKRIEKGRSVSYGRTFTARKSMMVATLPIGYSDGYLRFFSNKASVLIGGKICPVLGRVTMDQIVVDVSHVRLPQLGMPVVVLGRQGRQCVCADDLAAMAGTISYEIVCSLGNRLPRVYVNSDVQQRG